MDLSGQLYVLLFDNDIYDYLIETIADEKPLGLRACLLIIQLARDLLLRWVGEPRCDSNAKWNPSPDQFTTCCTRLQTVSRVASQLASQLFSLLNYLYTN